MSEETKNTAGNEQPLSSAVQPAKEEATPAAGGNADDSGYQQRINTLTAQKAHFQEKYEKLAAEHAAIIEAQKSEAEKAMDARVKEAVEAFKKTEYEPLAASADKFKAHIEADIDRMKGNIGDGIALPAAFDSWDVDVRHSYLSNLANMKPQPAPSVGAPANPPTEDPAAIIAGSEFRAWQSTDFHNPEAVKFYEANKEKMEKAFRDGRIDWNK